MIFEMLHVGRVTHTGLATAMIARCPNRLLRGKPLTHFDNFGAAAFTTLIVVTEEWVPQLKLMLKIDGSRALGFVIPVLLIGRYILMSLFIAVLLRALAEAHADLKRLPSRLSDSPAKKVQHEKELDAEIDPTFWLGDTTSLIRYKMFSLGRQTFERVGVVAVTCIEEAQAAPGSPSASGSGSSSALDAVGSAPNVLSYSCFVFSHQGGTRRAATWLVSSRVFDKVMLASVRLGDPIRPYCSVRLLQPCV